MLSDIKKAIAAKNQEKWDERLLKAAEAGDVLAIKQALKHGADPNSRKIELTITPLYYAVVNGHAEAVNVLLESGASVDKAYGYDCITPLHAAVLRGFTAIVKALLEAGASVDLRAVGGCPAGQTPLQVAASKDKMEEAKLLLAAEADLALKDGHDKTPVDTAYYYNRHRKLADYLQSVIDDPATRPTPEEVGLDMEKRIAALQRLGKPLGKFTEAEAKRIAQRKTREAQRQEALNSPSGGI